MASTSTLDHVTTKLFDNIKKLKSDGSNWDVWKSQVTLVLCHRKLLLYVNGTKLKLTAIYPSQSRKSSAKMDLTNLKDIEDWDQLNLEAQIQIFMTLDYEVASLVNGEVAADLWSALKSRFEGKGLTAVAMLASKLWQYNILAEKDVSMQIQDMKNITLKLSSLGYPLSDEYQAIAVLQALPNEWSTIRSIILNKSGLFTLQGTIDALLEHKNTLWKQQENVLLVHHDRKSRSPAPPSNKLAGSERPMCSNCKRPGHTIDQCWSEGGGAEGQAPKKKSSRSHFWGKGRKEPNANVARQNKSSPPPSNTYIFHPNQDALISKDSHTPNDFSYFIIDSGASAHMCHDRSYYTSYQKLNHPKHIWIADDHTIDAVGVSNIKVRTQLDGQSASGIIKGVLHLPELSVSLLSTAKLANAGVGTNTTLKHIDLINIHTSRLMDCAYCFHNLYKLKVEIAHSNEA